MHLSMHVAYIVHVCRLYGAFELKRFKIKQYFHYLRRCYRRPNYHNQRRRLLKSCNLIE